MRLSQKAIEQFKQLYQEEYGEELSDAEAELAGARLLRLYQILLENHEEPTID